MRADHDPFGFDGPPCLCDDCRQVRADAAAGQRTPEEIAREHGYDL